MYSVGVYLVFVPVYLGLAFVRVDDRFVILKQTDYYLSLLTSSFSQHCI